MIQGALDKCASAYPAPQDNRPHEPCILRSELRAVTRYTPSLKKVRNVTFADTRVCGLYRSRRHDDVWCDRYFEGLMCYMSLFLLIIVLYCFKEFYCPSHYPYFLCSNLCPAPYEDRVWRVLLYCYLSKFLAIVFRIFCAVNC